MIVVSVLLQQTRGIQHTMSRLDENGRKKKCSIAIAVKSSAAVERIRNVLFRRYWFKAKVGSAQIDLLQICILYGPLVKNRIDVSVSFSTVACYLFPLWSTSCFDISVQLWKLVGEVVNDIWWTMMKWNQRASTHFYNIWRVCVGAPAARHESIPIFSRGQVWALFLLLLFRN